MKIVRKNQSNTATNNTNYSKRSILWSVIIRNVILTVVFVLILVIIYIFAKPVDYSFSGQISQPFTIIETEGGTYLGPAIDLIYSGNGQFQHLNGGIYEGSFVNSMREGEGVFTWENGDSLKGTWTEDRLVNGTYTYANGLSYTGTFSSDTFDSGSFEGKTYFASGGSYEGSIDNSMRHGEGLFVWSNGDSFQGLWKNDEMLEGIYIFANGNSFSGTFDSNRFSTGVFTLSDLAEDNRYESFQANFTNGEITSFKFKELNGISYDGEITGNAIITYTNGDFYSGEVNNGVRDGAGVYKWKDSSLVSASYDGNWSEGVMSGNGKYFYSAGSYPYITGNFVNGKPEGTATYYKAAGNTFSTTWQNGKCISVIET